MTTISTAAALPFRSNRFLHILIALFLVVWAWSAIRPAIPEDWMLENLLVFFLVTLLSVSYRWLALSDLSYLLILVFLCLHECGAHYQYSGAVPGEWMKRVLRTERNHFDRVVHFTFGLFLAYPQREVLVRKARLRGGWTYCLPIFTTLALSAAYEIIEALVASIVDPTDAAAFLGSQGDQWDSQKDMFMGLAGASVAMCVLAWVNARQRTKLLRAASTVR
jgi:putative membrane protein